MEVNTILAVMVNWVERYPGIALAGLAGSYLVLLILVIYQMAQYGRFRRRQTRLMRGANGDNLEEMMLRHVDDARLLRVQMERVEQGLSATNDVLANCLQRTALLRYDAFGDISGMQSFSIAILDRVGNGLVVSSITSRSDIRVYAKQVEANVTQANFSTEERDVIAKARSGTGGTSEFDTMPRSAAR